MKLKVFVKVVVQFCCLLVESLIKGVWGRYAPDAFAPQHVQETTYVSEPAAVLAQGPQDLAGPFVETKRQRLELFEYLREAGSGVATSD